ncbi:MAG: family 20 glycosylhydrolase [Opitutaceae bacterium]|nr:family 20 glycosylhydrolase [Opitutaceae bacterium]
MLLLPIRLKSGSVLIGCLIWFFACRCPGAAESFGPVFPVPQEVVPGVGSFRLDETVTLAVPVNARAHDLFLARSLAANLAQWRGIAVRTVVTDQLPDSRVIVMGGRENPLVKQAEDRFGLMKGSRPPGEGYILAVLPEAIVVDGTDDAGAFHGLQSLRQLLNHAEPSLELPAIRIRDWPYKPIRGVKLYLPGRENIAFFKRFVADFMALYKFNYLFVEFNGAMRSDTHPEVNAGWLDLSRDLAFSRRDRPTGARGEYQDSPNQDVADGGIVEKEEVADLVAWARLHHVNFVPEVPSLSHSYYLLTRHRELADLAQANWEWPDAYDPDNPATYRLYFDILDEIIEATGPSMVHIGHDEWRVPLGNTDADDAAARRTQYIADLNRIHRHLSDRKIRTAIYGDHLLESVRGDEFSEQKTKDGEHYRWPGGLTRRQVETEIPKDILVFNWFWRDGREGQGEFNDIAVEDLGFEQVLGNFEPYIINYERRSARRSIKGGVPSSWAATNEFNFAKDLLYDFIGCANLTWSTHWLPESRLADIVQHELPIVRRYLSGGPLPSECGDAVHPLAVARSAAFPKEEMRAGLNPNLFREGTVISGNLAFDIPDMDGAEGGFAAAVGVSGSKPIEMPSVSNPIPIGADASSLIFLHALARPSTNMFAYKYVYNQEDSSDLMGYYEVVYEDGFVATVPIRYGYNILEWSSGLRATPRNQCYGARAVELGKSPEKRVTFFALEWPNPRLGRKIREVRLHGTRNFRSAAKSGPEMSANVIFLSAVSIVKPRGFPEPVSARSAEKPE